MSLKKQVFSGVFWTFSQQVSVQIINFGIQIVLARILMPQMFGLIAILQIFISIGNILLDSGMTSSLIRTENPDQDDYSTVFFINLLSSIGIYLLCFFCAPLIGKFYDQPILSPMLRLYTLSFIIQALVAVQTTILTKAMNFKAQMFMQIPSVIVGGVVGIVLARMGYGVWSLVWLNLVRSFLFMLLHWFGSKWRPVIRFHKEKAKHHFFFGYKLTFSGLITTLYQNIYTVIIGKMFSVTQLGYYNQASSLSIFPVANISTAILKVIYPTFSSIQNDNQKLTSVYKKLTLLVFFGVTPLMVMLALVAKPLFHIVLTEKWDPAIPYFQLLCIASIAYPYSNYNVIVMPAKGRSDLHFKVELIKKGVSTLVLIPLVFAGMWGVVCASAFSIIFHGLVNGYFAGKLIGYSLKQQLRDILPILLIGSGAAVLCLILGYLIQGSLMNNIIYIMFYILCFAVLYIIISFASKLPILRSVNSMFKGVMKKLPLSR